jgi:hypothetical protein
MKKEIMSSIFAMIDLMIMCGTVLTIAVVIALSIPDSKFRTFVMPIVGWGFAIFCGIYAISPIDVLPECLFGPAGMFDDIGAVIAGIMAARAAMKASKEKNEEESKEEELDDE